MKLSEATSFGKRRGGAIFNLIKSVIFILWAFVCGAGIFAEDKPDSAVPAPAAAQTKTVEELAALARDAVVIIRHTGRDGAVDGVGTGFLISSDGLIATSLHVIGEARPIQVEFANGKTERVTEVHAWDRKLDLAIIKIEGKDLPFLKLGDSDNLKQGESVVAMGNPQGLSHSVVQGVVSAVREFEFTPMIQLAIPIEPGNSGGPLLDMRGKVHGILSMKSAFTPNLGFATPINALKPLKQKPNAVPMDKWLTIGSQWKAVMGGQWTRRAGEISVEGAGSGFGGRALYLSQAQVPEGGYELRVSVQLDNEAGAAGLVFASDGDQRHYGFYPSGGQMRLTRFDGPDVFTWNILSQTRAPQYRPGEWNDLKVRVEKEKISCYVNDQLVVESADTGLREGKVGLAKFRQTKATFRNFQVRASGSAGPIAAIVDLKELNLTNNTAGEIPAALQEHPVEGRALLLETAQKLESEAKLARKLAGALHEKSVQKELESILQQKEEEIDLFYAALLISKLDNEDLDPEIYRQELARMVKSLEASIPEGSSPAAKIDALINFMFRDNGFHGSRTDYYNRANSYINDVMDDREGLPITLSVLFIELAHRIGLADVKGIPLPGHFVVAYQPKEAKPVFIDVFDGGRKMNRDEAVEAARMHSEVDALDKDFTPATKKEIILRMVRNLIGLAMQSEGGAKSLKYLDLVLALSPDEPMERWRRAFLRYETGNISGAKIDLKWILDKQPRAINLERVEELYRGLGEDK